MEQQSKNLEASESDQLATEKQQNDAGDDADEAFVAADGGITAWFVCFTSFCTNGTIFAIINCFGIISDYLIHNFQTPKSIAGSIGSATIGAVFLFSFIGSVVMDRIGIRICASIGVTICCLSFIASSFAVQHVALLFFTHSFLFGLGSSLIYTPSLVILGHHFDNKLGLANGLVALGSSVFSIALAQILRPMLLDKFGLANTFRAYLIAIFLMYLSVLSWKPMRRVKHSELDHYLSDGSLQRRAAGCKIFLAKFFNVSIWNNKGFVIWIIACPLALFGYFVPFMFLPNYVQELALKQAAQNTLQTMTNNNNDSLNNGISNGTSITILGNLTNSAIENLANQQAKSDSSLLLTCISIASSAARILVGKLADFRFVNRVRLQQFAFFTLGISISLFPLCRTRAPMIALSLLFGLCDGAFVCLIGPIAFDLVGPAGASQAIGFLLQMIAVPTMTGPLITGLLNDKTGRWDIPFYISGTLPIFGSAVMLLIPPTKQAYPAATVAEDFEQTARSNLDIRAYSEVGTDTQGIWQRAQSISGSLNHSISSRVGSQKLANGHNVGLQMNEHSKGSSFIESVVNNVNANASVTSALVSDFPISCVAQSEL